MQQPEFMARVHDRRGSGVGLPTGTSATVVRRVRQKRQGGRGRRRKQRGTALEPEQTWFVVSVRAVESRSCARRGPAPLGDAPHSAVIEISYVPESCTTYSTVGTSKILMSCFVQKAGAGFSGLRTGSTAQGWQLEYYHENPLVEKRLPRSADNSKKMCAHLV